MTLSEPTSLAASARGAGGVEGNEDTLTDESLPNRSGSRLESGTRLDRYHILEVVGQGGMGVVYAAYDADLDRKVALKVLHERGEPTDERAQQRLLREAQAMAKLSHPNVITVHEARAVAGRVFVSMEFIEGGTLTRWLEANRADRARVLAMFRDVGRGLAAAHAAGLVHRDVKPDNVLIGRGDRPRVTDFGLARPTEEGSEPILDGDGHRLSGETRLLDATLTRAGALVGTPAYMAPEQLERQPTTAASDQFSFCVALYEGLWGVRPFAGSNLAELATNILSGTITEPARDPGVPRWLRQVVMRGLSLRPEDRWPSMNALVERLEPSTQRSRRKRIAIAGVVGFALVGAGSLVSMGLSASPDPCDGGDQTIDALWTSGARDEVRDALAEGRTAYAEETATLAVTGIDAYAAQWATSHREACEAHHRGGLSAEALDLRGACLDDRLRELRALVSVLEQATPEARSHASEAVDDLQPLAPCEDISALRARVPLPTDPAAREHVQTVEDERARVQAMLRAGDYEAGLRRSDEVLQAARDSGYPPLVAKVLRDRAELHVRLGRNEAAAEELAEGWTLALGAGDDLLAAGCVVDLVDVLGYSLKRYDDAALRITDALAMIERIRRQDPWHAEQLAGDLDFARGQIELRHHRYAEAIALYERALDVAERQAGAEGLRVAGALSALASARLAQQEPERAVELYERVLEIRTKHLGATHPLTALTHNNIGLALKGLRRFDEAIAAFENARTRVLASLGPAHPSLRMIEINLAEVYFAVERYTEAAELYSHLYDEMDPTEIEDEWVLRRFVRYGGSLARTGRTTRARAVLTTALERGAELEPPSPERGTLLELARLELTEGHPELALGHLDAIPSLDPLDKPGPTAVVAVVRARALVDLGDRAGAQALLPIIHAADGEPSGPSRSELEGLLHALDRPPTDR